MRTIYLIRHAKPELPPGPRLCYGSLDLPLSGEGHSQGERLAAYMANRPVCAVFCSSLRRSRDTARYLTESPIPLDGLREQDAGHWEGLDFDTIRARWPDIYEQRGLDPTVPIPGGEGLSDVLHRFAAAIEQLLSRTDGDVAVVTHATAMRTFLCHILGKPLEKIWDFSPPYGSVTVLHWDGAYHLEQVGLLPAGKEDTP